MEKFNSQEYRNDLAKELRDIRKTDPEKATEILSEAKESGEYKNSESKYKRLKEWEKEAQKRFEENKDFIEQINNETPPFMSEQDYALEKAYNFAKKKGGTIDQFDIFDGKWFARDYADKYGSDYPGEFRRGQENHYKQKLIYENLGLFTESRKIEFIERIKNSLSDDNIAPHEAFRLIEALSFSGVPGEQLDKLKNIVLESGNVNVLRKTLEEFPISFSNEELHTVLQNVSDKGSLFDITKLIEMVGENNVDSKFIERRDSLLQKTKENFVENRKIIEMGVSNRDFLLHFTATPYLESILENGILSNTDQIKKFSKSNYGQGNDLQVMTGCFDTVSVFDVFKGADTSDEKDSKLFNEIRSKIRNLQDSFLRKNYGSINPACVFEITGINSFLKKEELNEHSEKEIFKKYTHIIKISKYSETRVDPNEVTSDGTYHKVTLNRLDKIILFNKETMRDKFFYESFFQDFTPEKKELLDSIKNLMKNAYIESNKDTKETFLDFERSAMFWAKKVGNPTLLIDPTVDRMFAQANAYSGESLVDGSISPDKILGAFANNAHLERYCYNEGKVMIDYKQKEELTAEDHENILFEIPEGAVVVKNLYKQI